MLSSLQVFMRIRHAESLRQTVRPLLSSGVSINGVVQRVAAIWQVLPIKELVLSMGLVLVMVLTALGVVYSSHISRELFAEQAFLQERNDQLQLEWAQLLLEQSAFTSPSQIESVAVNELEMILPDVRQIELVK